MEQNHKISYKNSERNGFYYNKRGNVFYNAVESLIWHEWRSLKEKKSKIKNYKQQKYSYQKFWIAECGKKFF